MRHYLGMFGCVIHSVIRYDPLVTRVGIRNIHIIFYGAISEILGSRIYTIYNAPCRRALAIICKNYLFFFKH